MTHCDISRFRIKVTAKHEFKWYVCVTGVDADVHNYDKKSTSPMSVFQSHYYTFDINSVFRCSHKNIQLELCNCPIQE